MSSESKRSRINVKHMKCLRAQSLKVASWSILKSINHSSLAQRHIYPELSPANQFGLAGYRPFFAMDKPTFFIA